MIKKIIQVLFVPIGGALGYWSLTLIEKLFSLMNISLSTGLRIFCEIAFVSLMAVAFYFLGGPISNWVSKLLSKITKTAKEMPATDMFTALVGLVIGLVVAFLICQIFCNISNELLVICINALIYICCGFLGIRVFWMRRDEIPFFEKRKKGEKEKIKVHAEKHDGGSVNAFAKNDFSVFMRLFHFDFAPIEKALGIDCFSVITNYKAIAKREKLYNKNAFRHSAKLPLQTSFRALLQYIISFVKSKVVFHSRNMLK